MFALGHVCVRDVVDVEFLVGFIVVLWAGYGRGRKPIPRTTGLASVGSTGLVVEAIVSGYIIYPDTTNLNTHV